MEGLLGERVCAFAVGAFLRFNLEAHLLDDGTTDEAPHAVGLPAGCGHQVLDRGPVRLAEQFQDRGLLAAPRADQPADLILPQSCPWFQRHIAAKHNRKQ